MSFNRRPNKSSLRGIARLAASLLVGLLTIAMPTKAQTQTFQGPVCAVPPTPQENDGWPKAAPDSLGNVAGPSSFAGSFLLSNDTGNSLSMVSVASTGSSGGTITGTDPYTYTPPATLSAYDVFTYEIRDGAGQTAVGIVKVGLIPDNVNPSVSISAPAADSTVSGNVTITAGTSDNVGVVRVQFFVDDVEIGNDVTSPFSVSWNSRNVADGVHTISALARDAAGNQGASAAIGVRVANAAATTVVPSVVGLAQADATGAINSVSLVVGSVTSAASSTVPVGNVISQSPTSGVTVTVGSAVSLVVSSGVASAAVPGVVGMTQAAAQSAITGAGFTSSVTTANSATVAAGNVISQNPTAGTSAVLGSSVAIVVSLGPAMAAVPNVVGMTQAAAQSAITGAGFSVTVTTANSATVAAGNVISQNPTSGTSAAVGSSVAIVVSLGPAATPPPANGLVLALGFDEASGTTAIDSSPSAKNGTIREAVRVPGKFGSALKFDGVNDWVTITDTTTNGPLDLATGMTLEAWVNPSQMSGWNTVMYKERGTAGAGLLCYALYAHDGAPETLGTVGPAGYVRLNPVASTADSGVRGATQIPLNAWTHLATTYDGTNQRFYVNGVLVKTVANPGAITQSNGALRIGGNNSSFYEFFTGLIDEVRVYNRALSASEIATDMTTAIVR